MNLLYLLSIIISFFIILKPHEKKGYISWVVYLLCSSFIYSIGTFKICADGWQSLSIGKMGACSHHGGIVTNLSGVGYVLFTVFIIFLFYKYKSF
jgi:hypothetical protein